MQANNPGHITLNDRQVKVQRWQQLPGRITLTVLIHGDQSGNEIKELLTIDSAILEVEDTPPLTVRPELTQHSVVGSGPTAVHRIQATLWLPEQETKDDLLEAQVERMQLEIARLWAEVNELKAERKSATVARPTGLRQTLQAGQTMIETEIDMGDPEHE